MLRYTWLPAPSAKNFKLPRNSLAFLQPMGVAVPYDFLAIDLMGEKDSFPLYPCDNFDILSKYNCFTCLRHAFSIPYLSAEIIVNALLYHYILIYTILVKY